MISSLQDKKKKGVGKIMSHYMKALRTSRHSKQTDDYFTDL